MRISKKYFRCSMTLLLMRTFNRCRLSSIWCSSLEYFSYLNLSSSFRASILAFFSVASLLVSAISFCLRYLVMFGKLLGRFCLSMLFRSRLFFWDSIADHLVLDAVCLWLKKDAISWSFL